MLVYATLICVPAAYLSEYVWRLPRLHIATGLLLVVLSALLVGLWRRDWNPAAQAFLGTTVLTCTNLTVLGSAWLSLETSRPWRSRGASFS